MAVSILFVVVGIGLASVSFGKKAGFPGYYVCQEYLQLLPPSPPDYEAVMRRLQSNLGEAVISHHVDFSHMRRARRVPSLSTLRGGAILADEVTKRARDADIDLVDDDRPLDSHFKRTTIVVKASGREQEDSVKMRLDRNDILYSMLTTDGLAPAHQRCHFHAKEKGTTAYSASFETCGPGIVGTLALSNDTYLILPDTAATFGMDSRRLTFEHLRQQPVFAHQIVHITNYTVDVFERSAQRNFIFPDVVVPLSQRPPSAKGKRSRNALLRNEARVTGVGSDAPGLRLEGSEDNRELPVVGIHFFVHSSFKRLLKGSPHLVKRSVLATLNAADLVASRLKLRLSMSGINDFQPVFGATGDDEEADYRLSSVNARHNLHLLLDRLRDLSPGPPQLVNTSLNPPRRPTAAMAVLLTAGSLAPADLAVPFSVCSESAAAILNTRSPWLLPVNAMKLLRLVATATGLAYGDVAPFDNDSWARNDDDPDADANPNESPSICQQCHTLWRCLGQRMDDDESLTNGGQGRRDSPSYASLFAKVFYCDSDAVPFPTFRLPPRRFVTSPFASSASPPSIGRILRSPRQAVMDASCLFSRSANRRSSSNADADADRRDLLDFASGEEWSARTTSSADDTLHHGDTVAEAFRRSGGKVDSSQQWKEDMVALTVLYDTHKVERSLYIDQRWSTGAYCGNGLLEPWEECDCGAHVLFAPDDDVTASLNVDNATDAEWAAQRRRQRPKYVMPTFCNACCDASRCLLRKSAICAVDGVDKEKPCCANCRPRAANTICRKAAEGGCDAPEICPIVSPALDGKCPDDRVVQHANPCYSASLVPSTDTKTSADGVRDELRPEMVAGYCWAGRCVRRKDQCQRLWGDDFRDSVRRCYASFNIEGGEAGNCGFYDDQSPSRHTNLRYRPCAQDDTDCGALHCAPIRPASDVSDTVGQGGGRERRPRQFAQRLLQRQDVDAGRLLRSGRDGNSSPEPPFVCRVSINKSISLVEDGSPCRNMIDAPGVCLNSRCISLPIIVREQTLVACPLSSAQPPYDNDDDNFALSSTISGADIVSASFRTSSVLLPCGGPTRGVCVGPSPTRCRCHFPYVGDACQRSLPRRLIAALATLTQPGDAFDGATSFEDYRRYFLGIPLTERQLYASVVTLGIVTAFFFIAFVTHRRTVSPTSSARAKVVGCDEHNRRHQRASLRRGAKPNAINKSNSTQDRSSGRRQRASSPTTTARSERDSTYTSKSGAATGESRPQAANGGGSNAVAPPPERGILKHANGGFGGQKTPLLRQQHEHGQHGQRIVGPGGGTQVSSSSHSISSSTTPATSQPPFYKTNIDHLNELPMLSREIDSVELLPDCFLAPNSRRRSTPPLPRHLVGPNFQRLAAGAGGRSSRVDQLQDGVRPSPTSALVTNNDASSNTGTDTDPTTATTCSSTTAGAAHAVDAATRFMPHYIGNGVQHGCSPMAVPSTLSAPLASCIESPRVHLIATDEEFVDDDDVDGVIQSADDVIASVGDDNVDGDDRLDAIFSFASDRVTLCPAPSASKLPQLQQHSRDVSNRSHANESPMNAVNPSTPTYGSDARWRVSCGGRGDESSSSSSGVANQGGSGGGCGEMVSLMDKPVRFDPRSSSGRYDYQPQSTCDGATTMTSADDAPEVTSQRTDVDEDDGVERRPVIAESVPLMNGTSV